MTKSGEGSRLSPIQNNRYSDLASQNIIQTRKRKREFAEVCVKGEKGLALSLSIATKNVSLSNTLKRGPLMKTNMIEMC